VWSKAINLPVEILNTGVFSYLGSNVVNIGDARQGELKKFL
jgi:hypothetical protein